MIRLSKDVSLPLDAVTQTFAILGKRGSGKTNTASVLAEQLIGRGLPVVYVDPIGVTWGLRHSRDGKGPGLPVIILGGEHADVPLEETGGAVIADFLIEHRAPAVLDLGLFSKGAQRRFMVDFAERLYHKNRQALHVMLDECDTFVPQRIEHGGERLVGAINDLVRKGRARGLGVTLISQRPALISKDVLTQVETLVAHRMTGPQDRDAVARWIEHNADQGGATVLASLQALNDGDAWVWSPNWLKRLVRTHVDLRATFDSSATPKAGERVTTPKQAAEVDLGALRVRLAATIEKAKSDDPRELKRRIADLEKRLGSKPTESPALSKEQERMLEETRRMLEDLRAEIGGIRAGGLPKIAAEIERVVGFFGSVRREVEYLTDRTDKLVVRLSEVPPIAAYGMRWTEPDRRPSKATATNGAARKPIAGGAGETMPSGHRRILLALARYGACSKGKLAILARYAATGGGFNNYLSALRSGGSVTGDGEGPYAITDPGLRALGDFDSLPEDPDSLFEEWMRHPELGKAHRAILRVLREHKRPMSKEDIAAKCDPPYEPGGGGFNNAIYRLRTLGVIDGRTAIELSEPLRS